jgi:hypothetical protein
MICRLIQITIIMVTEKSRFKFFLYIKIGFSINCFYPKHFWYHYKHIKGLKNSKKHPKNQNQLETKNQNELKYVFS